MLAVLLPTFLKPAQVLPEFLHIPGFALLTADSHMVVVLQIS
jgi:hypothetical protein